MYVKSMNVISLGKSVTSILCRVLLNERRNSPTIVMPVVSYRWLNRPRFLTSRMYWPGASSLKSLVAKLNSVPRPATTILLMSIGVACGSKISMNSKSDEPPRGLYMTSDMVGAPTTTKSCTASLHPRSSDLTRARTTEMESTVVGPV